MTPEEKQQASDAIWDMLTHTINGEVEEAADLLIGLGQTHNNSGMYAVCCGIAEAGKVALRKLYGDQLDPERGDLIYLQELKPGALAADPAEAFANRFLVAYANGDMETSHALFVAAVKAGGDEYISSVFALLASAGGLARLAIEPQEEAGQ